MRALIGHVWGVCRAHLDLMIKPRDALDPGRYPRQTRTMDKSKPTGKDQRQERLAQALRANLQRRKQAARASKQNTTDTRNIVTPPSAEVTKDGSD